MNSAKRHPNRVPFEGVLTRVDQPSDKAPSGARGHRVILTRQAAEDALWSLEGMAVAFKTGWDGHDPRQKCGVITDAFLDGDELCVRGHLYMKDFPEVREVMSKPDAELGMSYELADAHVADMRESIWTLTKVTFTGAAILLRAKAAYRSTKVHLSASADTGGRKLTIKGQMRKLKTKT